MTQPFNQRAVCKALGQLDTEHGEFWMENPWEPKNENLSAYERNRVLLNSRQGWFVDVSHLTRADLDSDSRSVAAGDFDEDGRPDLVVRNSGGGPLFLFANRWPKTHWLTLVLRGTRSNKLGVGARVWLETEEGRQYREVFPTSSFLSQAPVEAQFGLGRAERVRQLRIVWPSGTVQELRDTAADRRLVITEPEA